MRLAGAILGLCLTVPATVLAQPKVTTSSLPPAVVNQMYSPVQLTATGGTGPPYQWSLVTGNLPPGMNLTASGIINGTPTAAGTYPFTVRATDDTQQSGTGALSISVSGPAITTSSPLPDADANSFYKATFSATGGTPPYKWFLFGNGPPGLTMDQNSGILSGTPPTPGPFNFNVQVIDNASATSTQPFTLLVNQPLVIPNTSPLPNATVGAAYTYTFNASGGEAPYTFAVQVSPFNPNALPAGLSLSAKGVVSGTPTTTGTSNFTIFLTDNTGTEINKVFTLTVTPPLTIATASPIPPGTVGSPYQFTIVATGGTPPYVYFIANPPPGLSMNGAGVLSGTPTQPGTFTFRVSVSDSMKLSAIADLQVTFSTGAPLLTATPSNLAFTAAVGGDSPASEVLNIVASGVQSTAFRIVIDGGTPDIAAPPWLIVKTLSGVTPARVVFGVDQGAMPAGKYSARARIIDAAQNTTIVLVTLELSAVAGNLEVVPGVLNFGAHIATPGVLEQTVAVRNSGGGGPLSFRTLLVDNSSWVSSVLPASGQTVRNTLVFLNVRISTRGLAIGSHRDVIRFIFLGGFVDMPITVFVSDTGAILGANLTGVRLVARQGNGFSNTQTVQVLNLGDAASTVHWVADVIMGANLLSLSPTSGTATVSSPGVLTLTPSQAAALLAPGGHYALVRISDPSSRNSPVYVVVVFDLQSAATAPEPDPSPTGVVFIATANGPPPASQTVTVHTSSTAAIAFRDTASTADGGSWVNATPSAGTASTATPGQITISLVISGLASGIYTAELDIEIGGIVRTVTVTLIVLPSAGTSPSAAPAPAAGCAPAKIALTPTGLVNNFAVPAGWPAVLIAQLNDDCGAVVLNGSVAASFSNGDAPLTLRGDGQNGTYSATWQPGVVTAQTVVTLRATAGTLLPATAQLTGAINTNSAPVLFKNGTVNVFNRVPAGALAPGMIVEVYGSGLASATANPGVIPLLNTFNGTSIIVGPYQIPLYFLSDGQLDAQIAAELSPNQQYPILVNANGALTLPDTIDVVPVQLGIAAFPDGRIIAQHGVDSSYVDAAHPAKPGEVLVIYLSGMGPTNPSVKSGDPAPGLEPLARVTLPPKVTLDGQDVIPQFAGLTPGSVGLYQINFQVPVNAKSGDLNLVVTQNGVSSNVTKLPVAQ